MVGTFLIAGNILFGVMAIVCIVLIAWCESQSDGVIPLGDIVEAPLICGAIFSTAMFVLSGAATYVHFCK